MRCVSFLASTVAAIDFRNITDTRNATDDVSLKMAGQNPHKFENNIQILKTMLNYMFKMSGQNRVDADDLLSYGCWCQIDSEFSTIRKGLPVDETDRKCQDYYRCGRCVLMDTVAECDPTDQIYGFYYDPEIAGFKCGERNNRCQMKVCMCDVHFVNNVVPSLEEYNSYYANSHGWMPDKLCKANLLTKGPADKCCGRYPERFPYNSEEGTRDCCAGKTFNSINLDCCSGVLLSKGSCPSSYTPNQTANNNEVCKCLNGGTCTPTESGSICACPIGFTGNLCEWGPCDPNPCANGKCIVNEDGYSGYSSYSTAEYFSCECFDQWTGKFCDQESTRYSANAKTSPPTTIVENLSSTDFENVYTNVMTHFPTKSPSTLAQNWDGACEFGFQGQFCDKLCSISINQPIDLAIVIETAGSKNPEKHEAAKDFIQGLLKEFDTTHVVKVSVTVVGDYRTDEIQQVLAPVQFITDEQLTDVLDSITWFGGFTAVAGGLVTAAQTLDLTDEIRDYMIVITDGFDGDLGTLQITSAAIAADDIQAIGIGFESSSVSPAILKSTLEEIAQGRESNVFIANSANELQSHTLGVFNSLCSLSDDPMRWKVREIRDKNTFEAAAKYKTKFGSLPAWTPNFQQWRKQEVDGFTFERI